MPLQIVASWLQLSGVKGLMMAATKHSRETPFRLVVTGQAEDWAPALRRLIGPRYMLVQQVENNRELIDAVESHQVDAAVVDDQVDWARDGLKLLRMIRRIDTELPVVIVTHHQDRQFLQSALQLRAYIVVNAPLGFEQLVRQIYGMMCRMEQMLRDDMNQRNPFDF